MSQKSTAGRFVSVSFRRAGFVPAPFLYTLATIIGLLGVRAKATTFKGGSMKQYTVAILGATGAVGTQMLECLNEQEFPVGKLKLLASARSAGKTVEFRGEPNRDRRGLPRGLWGLRYCARSRRRRYREGAAARGRQARRCRGRQQPCLPHGSRGAAGRTRDQCRRYQVASRPYRQPQLRDHYRPGSHLAAASARRREAHDRLDVPGGFGRWRSRYGRARGPAGRPGPWRGDSRAARFCRPAGEQP